MAKDNESITQIKFEYEGTEYIMEFDRATVQQTEKVFDVSLGDVRDGKLSALEGLFRGAFLKHHPNMKQTTMDMLFELMPDKQGIFQALALMYGNCVETLFAEPEKGKAISWKAM